MRQKKNLAKTYGFESNSYKMQILRDGPENQLVFVLRYPFGYKNVQLISKHVDFTAYLDWVGQARELSFQPILNQIIELTSDGKWGIATNSVKLKIVDALSINDVLEVRLWLEKIIGYNKIYFLSFDFYKVLNGKILKKVAACSLVASFVEIKSHGKAILAPPPHFICDYFEKMTPRSLKNRFLLERESPFANYNLGRRIFSLSSKPKLLFQQSYRTTLDNSNFIGNVYFSNYGRWVNSTKDLFLYENFPKIFRGSGSNGEFVTLEYKISHHNEAMPFDEVIVKMYVSELYAKGVVLRYDVMKKSNLTKKIKLATVTQVIAYVKYSGASPEIVDIPRKIISLFRKGLFVSDQ